MVGEAVEFEDRVPLEQATETPGKRWIVRSMEPALAVCLALLLIGCGSSGGSDDDNTDDTPPAGKVRVDGHVFNPDFFDDGRDFYALVSYFNADGSLDSYHEIYEWDGEEPTYLNDYRYAYDGSGRLDSEEQEFTYTREAPALYNHLFSTIEYDYDGNGRLSSELETITAYDNDGDGDYNDSDFGTFVGATPYEKTYTYDGSGRLATEIHDDEGDTDLMGSSADEQITYQYDGSSNLVQQTILDGIGITTTLVYEYDTVNPKKRLRHYPTMARFIADDPDFVTEYFYDAEDRLEREETDSGVYNSSDRTLDGNADSIITYGYGSEGEPIEKSTEELFVTNKRIDKIQYLHEVIDDNNDGTPESTVTYVFWLDTQNVPIGDNYMPDDLPDWVLSAQIQLNNGNADDGWGLNWEGHGSTCTTCGNMLGEVNRIVFGF